MANAADNVKKLKLTVFLIKPGYADVPDFMHYGGLSTVSIQSGRHKGTLALTRSSNYSILGIVV